VFGVHQGKKISQKLAENVENPTITTYLEFEDRPILPLPL
jgi:hypothetical protein